MKMAPERRQKQDRRCVLSIINVKNLTFGYEGSADNVFENVSFQMDTSWRLGFTGRNGRGKTTFLKLLTGEYEYSGSISADVDFEYFPYEVEDQEEFAIDVIRRTAPAAEDWQIARELSLLDAEDILYQQFDTLSYGERTKALLAGLFLRDNLFLLIDEPTNHLDVDGRRRLSEYLSRKKGFILVSHDRAFLDGCIDHVLAINRSNIEIQKGNFSSWMENKRMQDEFEAAEKEKLQKDIRRLSQSARQSSDWSDRVEKSKKGTKNSGSKLDKGYVGHKAAKMMKRSKSLEVRREKMIGEKQKLLKNVEQQDDLKILPLKFHSGRLLELSDLSICYGEEPVLRGVNFTVEEGDRIALSGKNGSGKSSLLKLICGEDIPYEGRIYKNRQLVVSYISQNADGLKGNLREYASFRKIEEHLLKSYLVKLGFSRQQLDRNMEHLSSGQKKKILLAASLCEKAHLYVWDEPLNYIDVISRMQLEELLLEFQPTLLFVEHDRVFCDRIATKTVKL